MFSKEFTYFVLLPLAATAVLLFVLAERRRNPRGVRKAALSGGIYLAVTVGSMLTLHSIAENVISRLIREDRLPVQYLTGMDGGFNYSTVEAFMVISLALGILFFTLLIFYRKGRLFPTGIGILTIYAGLVLWQVSLYPQLAPLILIPWTVIVVTLGSLLHSDNACGTAKRRLYESDGEYRKLTAA